MRLLRTRSSSMRQNSPSASEAADRFNENFAGCCRSNLPVIGQPLDRLLDDPAIDAAVQIRSGGGADQFLEAEPRAIRRTHAQ